MKIGIIGCGDMGCMMAKVFSAHTSLNIYIVDLPEKVEELNALFILKANVFVSKHISDVCKQADFVIFAVETHAIEKVVSEAAQYIESQTIVAGQTSIKAPEMEAFEKYLNPKTPIVTVHSLHGPNISPINQILLFIAHRANEKQKVKALDFWKLLGSNSHELESHQVHDKLMADVQVVTHIGFESIGTSFMHRGIFPWENPIHKSGLDNLKLLLTLRIFSYKPHVYSGLAMFNPFAKQDVRTYANAENELF